MKKSAKLYLSSLLLLISWAGRLKAIPASGGDYDLTKCLIGESGVNQATSPDYSSAYALGEDVAGTDSQDYEYDLVTGYFSGYASGNVGVFSLLNTTIGTTKITQDGYQVGVPLNATVQLAFSSPLDPTTIAGGIQVFMVMDHLGQTQNAAVPFTYTYDATGSTVVISAQGSWLGNSIYQIKVNTSLQSIDGFVLVQEADSAFVTVLDPHQENVILHPMPSFGNAAASSLSSGPLLSLDIPTDSLSDYSYVLVSQDPIHAPLLVDPNVLLAATQKAQASGGAYETPLALQEIAAYNAQGRPMSLAKMIEFTLGYSGGGIVSSGDVPIRPQTLSLWALDSTHNLWVKMPDSRPNGTGVASGVTQFSVYALMGSADGDASTVNVFPNPWRPNGPDAGNAAGQTGSESAGVTFNNLPSECSIKIYTLSGRLVRELHHSDLVGPVGQEKWDGNTSSGDHAASGLYLWRVESSTDGKNGKLIIIR